MERILLTASILTSSLVWTWVAIRLLRSKSAVRTAGVVEPVSVTATTLGVSWVLLGMATAGGVHFGFVKTAEVTLESVRQGVVMSGVVAFAMAIAYSLGNTTQQENQLTASQSIGIGILGALASLMPVLMVQFALKSLLNPDGPSHELLRFLQDNKSPGDVMWVAAAALVTAPLLEEIVYRVILQGSLRAKVSPNQAILISAVVFAAVHGWPNMLGLLPLALILGYLYDRTNSYLTVVTAHAVFNMTMLLMSTLPTATWFAIIM